jgi:hypothetical protein
LLHVVRADDGAHVIGERVEVDRAFLEVLEVAVLDLKVDIVLASETLGVRRIGPLTWTSEQYQFMRRISASFARTSLGSQVAA